MEEEYTELSDADKIYGLAKFWQEVSYNFAFFDQVPELDWDKAFREYIPKVLATKSTAEYYRVLDRFAALLKDGHTDISWPDYATEHFVRPKIRLREVNRRAIVVNVGESLKNEIPLGSEIVEVNGVPTGEYLKKNVFPFISSSTDHILWYMGVKELLYGPSDTGLAIKIQTEKGVIKLIDINRNSRFENEIWAYPIERKRPRFEFKWLEDGLAYIALNTFVDKKILEDFELLLPSLYDSKGIILDIRKNGGGYSDIGWDIIKYFTSNPFLSSKWKTREHRASFKAWGKQFSELSAEEMSKLKETSPEDIKWINEAVKYYNGAGWYERNANRITPGEGRKISAPVVVLIGPQTASAAEDFLISLSSINRATFVGKKTFGSTGQPLIFGLPGGGSARVCTKRDTYPDGRDFVGYGISPHIYIDPTVEDVLSDRDVILEKGVDVLKKNISLAKD